MARLSVLWHIIGRMNDIELSGQQSWLPHVPTEQILHGKTKQCEIDKEVTQRVPEF